MSTLLGMADGRCITEYTSSRNLNDALMSQQNIAFQDNYAYRMALQSGGPDSLNLPLQNNACDPSPSAMTLGSIFNNILNL